MLQYCLLTLQPPRNRGIYVYFIAISFCILWIFLSILVIFWKGFVFPSFLHSLVKVAPRVSDFGGGRWGRRSSTGCRVLWIRVMGRSLTWQNSPKWFEVVWSSPSSAGECEGRMHIRVMCRDDFILYHIILYFLLQESVEQRLILWGGFFISKWGRGGTV